MTGSQLRAARKLVGLTRFRLTQRSGVSETTIERFERDGHMTQAVRPFQTSEQRIALIRTALESAGVEFIDEDGGGPGVRLQTPPPDAARK